MMFQAQDTVIVCSTARLARSLRLAHDRQQRASGAMQWQPLPALTLSQWLANSIDHALLQGDISLQQAPRLVLNKGQELALWQRIIEHTLGGDSAALFDSAGLAKAALEANRLMQEWNVAIPQHSDIDYSEEVLQFLRWRAEFRQQCQAQHWLEATRYTDWQIAQLAHINPPAQLALSAGLAHGATGLPAKFYLAGFDRSSPQEQRLFDVLRARGVTVQPWPHLRSAAAHAGNTSKCELADCEAECRSAVAWAAHKLATNPKLRLAIVVPELANLRQRLTALLDDTLHPLAVSPAHAEMQRSYDLSLGEALSRHPLAAAALDLLRLAAHRHAITQQDVSRLLLGAYWSSPQEADACAQLDARMRALLPLKISLERLLRFCTKQAERGLPIPRLLAALQALLDAPSRPSPDSLSPDRLSPEKTSHENPAAHQLPPGQLHKRLPPSRQLPSMWAAYFDGLLAATGWPGGRSPSSHEFQAKRAFSKALASLAEFDALAVTTHSGALSFAQAVQRLSHICAEQIFQPESQDDPQLLVMGMLETVATPLDAMWVMGMNDHVWPPAARPNPLLPAHLQRAARAPNADGPVQAEFAQTIHARLLASAQDIVFSWARKSGESELRISPLLQGIAEHPQSLSLAATLAETLALQAADAEHAELLQWLDDHHAPAVQPSEKISGGAGLIRAQAICPAWAYYRYRLGAKPLEEAVDGLDSMDRGNLVHAVLQSFWQGHGSDYLHAMDDAQLRAAIIHAVEQGVSEFAKKREEALAPNFLLLEKQRLQLLLAVWLAFEKERPPFSVEQCEQKVTLDIAGLSINLTLDRVDSLDDGRLVVIDYKTGSAVSHHSWADERIAEPQLPIYAALAMAEAEIAAVCFAQVRADEQRFIGIAADAELLPGIKALTEATRTFPPALFPDWPALISNWQRSLLGIAQELMAGQAAVVFQDKTDLLHCEVKPILRLPERYLQLEKTQGLLPNTAADG